ncbi:helix-turn-helix domain-containing protein [Sphingobacterium multivorum]|uniref:helix-turn-helix domain-containing protein n=1 Tax=Sphingobacterium multivorum TaxID=28454 RepID=UPI0028A657FD|nr:helix-turn-helix domain-containing protein [Sphingobacterium multivorum]
MQIDIITREDLKQFKAELLDEIKTILKPSEKKQWVRSADVRRMLNISAGTLQNLRINGTLRHSKVGGIMYYRSEDIQQMMEGGGA